MLFRLKWFLDSFNFYSCIQVALSLLACIYFLNDKTKSVARASIIGYVRDAKQIPMFPCLTSIFAIVINIYFFVNRCRLGSLVVGWFCGSCVAPMIPTVLLQPTWTPELLTSLVAYVFLFVGCTLLK